MHVANLEMLRGSVRSGFGDHSYKAISGEGYERPRCRYVEVFKAALPDPLATKASVASWARHACWSSLYLA
jgi:hypothetical protein